MKLPLFRILSCIAIFWLTLYAYIDSKNTLTELRFQIPKIERQLHVVREENTRLQYEIERFESPIHLMELSRKPEFGHLRYPYLKDVEEILITWEGL